MGTLMKHADDPGVDGHRGATAPMF